MEKGGRSRPSMLLINPILIVGLALLLSSKERAVGYIAAFAARFVAGEQTCRPIGVVR